MLLKKHNTVCQGDQQIDSHWLATPAVQTHQHVGIDQPCSISHEVTSLLLNVQVVSDSLEWLNLMVHTYHVCMVIGLSKYVSIILSIIGSWEA